MTIDDSVRIRVIRALLGMDSQSFAKRLGVCPATQTNWEKGRTTPSADKRQELYQLCEENGIGFLPSGFPVPVASLLMFKLEEFQNA